MTKEQPTETNFDLVKYYFPNATPEFADFVLWEYTGYPCFFYLTKDYPTPISRLRKQLREFKYQTCRKLAKRENHAD